MVPLLGVEGDGHLSATTPFVGTSSFPSPSFLQLPLRMGHRTNGILYTVNILRILKQQAGAATIAQLCSKSVVWLLFKFQMPLEI